MRLLMSALFLSVLSMPAVAEAQVEIFTCKPWSNGGLRMKGDVQLEPVSYTHLTLPTN